MKNIEFVFLFHNEKPNKFIVVLFLNNKIIQGYLMIPRQRLLEMIVIIRSYKNKRKGLFEQRHFLSKDLCALFDLLSHVVFQIFTHQRLSQ